MMSKLNAAAKPKPIIKEAPSTPDTTQLVSVPSNETIINVPETKEPEPIKNQSNQSSLSESSLNNVIDEV